MGTKYILSLSGGKDSTIALYLILQKNYPLDEVFCALLPFEEPEMYEHLEKLDKWLFKRKGINITFIENKKPIEPFMAERTKRGVHKGTIRGFPLKGAGFCWISRDWKIVPLQKYANKYAKDNGCVIHTYLGFTIDEKNKSREVKIKNYLANKEKFVELYNESYPLVDFKVTEEKARSLLKVSGLGCKTHFEYNRSGCWFCQKSRKEARLRAIRKDPARLKLLKKWREISGREIYPDLNLDDIVPKTTLGDY